MKRPSKNLTSWLLAGLVLFFAVCSTTTTVGDGYSSKNSISPRSASFNHLFSFFNSSSRRYAANRLVEPSNIHLEAVLPVSTRVLVASLAVLQIPKIAPVVVSYDGSLKIPLRI